MHIDRVWRMRASAERVQIGIAHVVPSGGSVRAAISAISSACADSHAASDSGRRRSAMHLGRGVGIAVKGSHLGCCVDISDGGDLGGRIDISVGVPVGRVTATTAACGCRSCETSACASTQQQRSESKTFDLGGGARVPIGARFKVGRARALGVSPGQGEARRFGRRGRHEPDFGRRHRIAVAIGTVVLHRVGVALDRVTFRHAMDVVGVGGM